jgi:hypothetical protein
LLLKLFQQEMQGLVAVVRVMVELQVLVADASQQAGLEKGEGESEEPIPYWART